MAEAQKSNKKNTALTQAMNKTGQAKCSSETLLVGFEAMGSYLFSQGSSVLPMFLLCYCMATGADNNHSKLLIPTGALQCIS